MAANLGSAYITVTPKFDGLSAAANRALSSVDVSGAGATMGGKAAKGFGWALAKGGAIAGAVSSVASKAFDAISSSIGSAVSRVDTIANFTPVMENLGYGADEAQSSISRLSAGIDGLPTSLDGIVSMTQQLAPLCGGLDNATTMSLALNDAFNASGAGVADQTRAMQQYSQMLAKGSVDLQSWRTLQEVMPGQLNQVSEALLGAGHNSNDLYEALKDGTVGFQDFNNAFVQLDQQGINGFASFHDQAYTATQGIGTAMTNVQNRIAKAMASIIDSIGQANISGAINAFSSSFAGKAQLVIGLIEGIKQGLADSGAAEAFASIGSQIQAVMPSVDTVKQGFKDVGTFLGELTGKIAGAFADSGAIQTCADAVDAVKQALSDAASSVQQFVDNAGGLSQIATNIAPVAAGIAAVLVPLKTLQGIGTAGSFLGFAKELPVIGSAISGVTGVFGNLKGAVEGVKGAFATLSLLWEANPAGVIIIAIAGIVAALVTLYNTNEDFRNGVNGVVSAVVGFVTGTLVPAFETAASTIGSVVSTVASTVGSVISSAVAMGQSIVGMVASIAASIASTVGSIASAIAASQIFQGFVNIVAGIVSNVQGALSVLVGIVQTVVGFIVGLVTGDFSMMAAGVQGVIDGIAGMISGVSSIVLGTLQVIASVITAVISTVIAAIQVIASAVAAVISTVIAAFEAIVGTVSSIFGTVVGVVEGIWNGLVAFISAVPGAVIGFFTSIPGAIAGFFQSASSMAQSAVSGLASFMASVPGAIVGFFASIPGAIGGFFDNAKNAAVNAFNSLVNTVSSIPGKIVGFFSGIGERISSAFGSIHFPQPSIDWTSVDVMGQSISIPKISFHASGGVFDHLSVFGEKDPEMVTPLNRRSTAPFADLIAERMNQNGGSADESAVIAWLAENLPEIISSYTPTIGGRDFRRMAKAAVNA